MGTGIKGFKSQKILKTKLSGYTETESVDPERYVTIQELTGDKHGADVVIHGGFEIDGITRTAAAGSNIRILKAVGHGAQKGDFVRFKLSGIEASILSVPDADTIILASELSSSPVGLEFLICRHITPSYNADGSLNVLASQGPVQFNKDASIVQVNEDTAVVANNKPLPNGMFIKKDDGNYYPVTLDTTNPYNHTPIPVAITDVAGTANVNITAGDLNVSIKHNGVDPSSVRIGDGTNLAAVNASNELKVIDTDTHTKLDTLHSDLAKDTNGWFPTSLHGVVDTGNSRDTILGANITFTGVWKDITNFAAISIGVVTDVDSAVNGIKFQFSSDGINVHHEHTFTYISGGYGVGYNVPVEYRYFRVQYVNGGSAQNVFHFISTLKQVPLFPSSYKLIEPITGQTQALFTRGVIVGETTGMGGGYVNVKVSPSGAVQVGGTVTIDQTTPGTTNGVVVNSSALPSGAATEAKQDTGNTSLSSIDTKLSSQATAANQVTANNSLSSIDTKLSSAATSALQTTGNNSLSSLDTNLGAKADAVATTDTGTFSLIALFKRSLEKLSTIAGKADVTGTITQLQPTVGVTAVRATVSGSAPVSRKKLMIKPSKNNTGAIYIGSSSVTISTGMEIIGPDRLEFLNDSNDYYLISDTAGQVVEIVEVY